jgi:hypothetical protein
MGVPVLTLSGRSFASRVCGSLVRSAGLPELVCETPEDFVEQAVALAADPARLQSLRARLEASRDTCVTFDMDLLTSELEGLYQRMCEDHQAGLTPQPDLRNLEAYLEAGVQSNPDVEETLAVLDYHERYIRALAARHRMRPLPADDKLWTQHQIAMIDGRVVAETAAAPLAMAAE